MSAEGTGIGQELTGELGDAERYRFEADGFLVVERALDDDHVAALRRALADVAAGAGDYGADHQGDDLLLASGQLRTVTNPLAGCPSVLDAALHPGFFPKIYDLFRGRVRLLSNEYFVTPPRSKPRLTWHRDADERNYAGIDLADSLVTLNALVLLSDVGPENGPTLAIPGSHRWPEHRSVSSSSQGAGDDPSTLRGHVALCGPAGTAVFFNSRLSHSQSRNASDSERHALVLVYGHRWMRAFDGYVPGDDEAAALADSPLARQLLGLGPAFDAPCAPYEVPRRWSAGVRSS
jgi:ectoine hydroxylase-related dioxygenase (phytanoyl-CoA dioxygenase family)